jgi:hypothetical protein
MYLGTGTVKAAGVEYQVSGNVYLPDTLPANADPRVANPYNLYPIVLNLYNRPQFAGQFWVGVVAWPAIIQYLSDDEAAVRRQANELRQASERQTDESERLKEEASRLERSLRTGTWRGNPLLGQFERAPTEEALNALNTSRGKELELGWVYTVIAGVLNIMVIYDAIAGPAFPGGLKPTAPVVPAP